MDPFIPVRSEPETYEPPSFLVSSTQLSIQDLVRLYHVFMNSTRYIDMAPELVFERLMSNIAELCTARSQIERIQGPGSDSQSLDTIRLTLADITREIQTLRDEIASRQNQDNKIASSATARVVALFDRFRLDISASSLNDPPLARVLEPQTESTVRIVLTFPHKEGNTGVRMEAGDVEGQITYPTDLPWLNMHDEYPHVQWGCHIANRNDPTESRITFPRTFARLPSVTCWLTGFETTGLPFRARVSSSQVTTTGFVLRVEPPTLCSVGVSWLAGLPLNQVGTFAAQASGMWPSTPPLSNGFTVTGQRTYTRLAVAITQVDIAGTPALPMTLEPQLALGCDYFSWSMKAGSNDKGLYLLKAAFMMI